MDPAQGAPPPGESPGEARDPAAGDDVPPRPASEAVPESGTPEAVTGEVSALDVELAAARARLDEALAARDAAVHAAEAAGGRSRAGLLRWAAALTGGAFVSILVRQPDFGLFLVIAAIFALAASWDMRDRARTGDPTADLLLEPGAIGHLMRALLPAALPALGALCYGGLAVWTQSRPPSPEHTLAFQWMLGASLVCAAMMFPPVSQWFASLLVKPPANSHTARLTASIAMMALLLPVPARLLFGEMMEVISGDGQPLLSLGGLISQLAGEVAIALAAVGLWVSRTPRETWARLGLGRMGGRDWLVAAVGLAVLLVLNVVLESAQKAWFPELAKQDQAMIELMTRDLSLATVLVLGVSAGVGEELLMRGALQPRTGIVWASVIFAVAHVQYTWFGIAFVAMVGIGLGLIRLKSNTTTAIVVHGLYDIILAGASLRN
jgi:hypothetical protein